MDDPNDPAGPADLSPFAVAQLALEVVRADGGPEDLPELADPSVWRAAAHRLADTAVDLERELDAARVELVEVSDAVERTIRREERERLAAVFEENAAALEGVSPDGNLPTALVVLLLRMDNG